MDAFKGEDPHVREYMDEYTHAVLASKLDAYYTDALKWWSSFGSEDRKAAGTSAWHNGIKFLDRDTDHVRKGAKQQDRVEADEGCIHSSCEGGVAGAQSRWQDRTTFRDRWEEGVHWQVRGCRES